MLKTCSKCKQVKDSALDYYKQSGNTCKECRKAYLRDWRARSRDWLREYRRTKSRGRDIERAAKWNKDNAGKHRKHSLDYYYRLQDEAINAYGGYRCACCGESEPLFMSLDHINNDGSAFRKASGFLHHGSKFYKWLKDTGYPSGYQVLCSNCNHGKFRNHGVCPHQET